ncbi:rhodanese-like domain-containing protein [Desulfosediminicola flagellatus]|uniref:rhodanese-like domain-containing protein n=1 Tax=Desulfosediminicola flagellatus TaxID=2569541 RepID=UPI0010AD27D1|nr:rhodanese-like domain-containing protein [Desulfosediminicola flagellatus]
MRLKTFLHPLVVAFFSVVIWTVQSPAATLKDTESATHADKAAIYDIVNIYDFEGFKLIQATLGVLSHYSYILESEGQALIVDPGRDVQFYLDTAQSRNLKIVGVFLSHSHADFVAGHMELVKATGCPIYQSSKSNAQYTISPVDDGAELKIGKARLVIRDTPGHVIDGSSALVYSPDKQEPELMLSGDYLFVGSVGRPDLVKGTTSAALAGALFDTWHQKISKLPDAVKVFPAHGAGSLCGAHLRDAPFTTIGEERTSNPYLQHSSRSEFITAVLSELSEPPQYFAHNAAMNMQGPELIDQQLSLPEKLLPDVSFTDIDKYIVVDIRDAKSFAQGHIPNSINIAIRGRFETWTGIMIPWDSHLVLCGEENDLIEAFQRLHRVGYTGKHILYSDWQKAGLPQLHNELISPENLYSAMQAGTEPIIVDVRLPNEWMGLRIGTVLNLPLNKLAELSAKLDHDNAIVAVCNSAYRSTMAIGIFERNGFSKVTSLDGGSEAWIHAGYPVYGSQTQAVVANAPRKIVPLPERICGSELQRLIIDLPNTYDLVDIRPPESFSDFNLPGSTNVHVADLINNPAFLTGAGPLIVVDRDGTLAMALAGILSQKTQRPIKALYGGLEAYWNLASGSHAATQPIPGNVPSAKPAMKTVPSQAPKPAAPVQQPQPPTRKSAGC